MTPHKKKEATQFDAETLEDYFEAKDRCVRVVALYQQAAHARAEAASVPDSGVVADIEAETVGDYLAETVAIAEILSRIADRIPSQYLEAILQPLPEQVLRDLHEFEPT